MTEPERRSMGIRDVIRLRDFRQVWLGQVISDIGDGTTLLLLLLVVNELTHSTTALAILSIALVLPKLTVGLVAGVYVDRWDRRRTMLAADLLRMAVVVGFAAAAASGQVWLLVALALLESGVGTFFTPARGALIPHVVPREGLPAANSLSQATVVVAGVVGSAIGGVLFGIYHAAWPGFVLDAATFGISFLMILRVSASAGRIAADEHAAAPAGVLASLGAGLSIVRHSRLLTGTLLGVATTMLGLGAVNVLFVPLLIDELHVSPAWMGAVDGAQALSMVMAATVVAWLMARLAATSVITGALAGLALFTLALAGATSIWEVIVLLYVAGWFITPLQAAVATIVQTAVADSSRGRLGSLMSAAASTANVLSMALAGIFGDLLTTRTVYVLAAGVCGMAAVIAWVIFRGIRPPDEEAARAEPLAPEAAAARPAP
jgi:DHA3 family macrolide efflux protein-like MFS transporter